MRLAGHPGVDETHACCVWSKRAAATSSAGTKSVEHVVELSVLTLAALVSSTEVIADPLRLGQRRSLRSMLRVEIPEAPQQPHHEELEVRCGPSAQPNIARHGCER